MPRHVRKRRDEPRPVDLVKTSARTLAGAFDRVRAQVGQVRRIPEKCAARPGQHIDRAAVSRKVDRVHPIAEPCQLRRQTGGRRRVRDVPRGDGRVRGHDEINEIKSPGNYGWPLFIGNNFPYHKHDFITGKPGPAFDPARPVNPSSRNTGLKVLPAPRPALIYYPYNQSEVFPELGTGGVET